MPAVEHIDVIVVGAGLSGVCAGYHLQQQCPNKSYAILEGREVMGGTWDLFRYPGIRSDSDMFTLGFPFKPWTADKVIADGDVILDYIQETAEEFGIDQHIRYQHKVVSANWDSERQVWDLSIQHGDGRELSMTCGFMMMCSGYYSYEGGYTPEFKGQKSFKGDMIHPQEWPQDIAISGKKFAVIGSGATAMTLVPSLEKMGAEVTMIQRSPTYVIARDDRDALISFLYQFLPRKTVFGLARWRNALLSQLLYIVAQRYPKLVRKWLLDQVREEVGDACDVEKHFAPTYNPWDQRLCLVPNGDLFASIKRGNVKVVTDTIEKINAKGVAMADGTQVDADYIVTATGLNLVAFGNIAVSVDGDRVQPGQKFTYKGLMLNDVPNLVQITGYTNASWTLKADLSCQYATRLINHIDLANVQHCVPRLKDAAIEAENALGLDAGYIRRAAEILPKQGNRRPWKMYQNYLLDVLAIRYSPLENSAMEFGST